MTPPRTFTVPFIKKEQVSKDAYSFFFQKPADFQYEAGQYLRLSLPISKPDERGTSRFFTIASSPTENQLMITTRIIKSSFKKTLDSLTAQTSVTILAPFGNFTLLESDSSPRVFISGGIGITPYRSMLRYAVDAHISLPITLFTSFSTTEEMVFTEELHSIADQNKWFTLVETITQPTESKAQWTGRTGRIDHDLIREHIKNLNSSIFYISGPPALVENLTTVVKELGVESNKIKVEKFSGY